MLKLELAWSKWSAQDAKFKEVLTLNLGSGVKYQKENIQVVRPCSRSHVCVRTVCVQSCSTLWPHGLYPPDSSVHGILQARILEQVTISSSRGSLWLRERTRVSCISCIGRRILYHWATWEALVMISTFFPCLPTQKKKVLEIFNKENYFSILVTRKILMTKTGKYKLSIGFSQFACCWSGKICAFEDKITCYVILGKWHHLSESQFHHLQSEGADALSPFWC